MATPDLSSHCFSFRVPSNEDGFAYSTPIESPTIQGRDREARRDETLRIVANNVDFEEYELIRDVLDSVGFTGPVLWRNAPDEDPATYRIFAYGVATPAGPATFTVTLSLQRLYGVAIEE